MRVLLVIITNTLREGLRKNFFISLLGACFLVLCLSLIFSQLSLDDKGRLTVDFGLATIQILLVILSVFFGSGLISNDLEGKVIWNVLTRPVRPALFFFGRYLALSIIIILALVALSFLLIVFFVYLKIPIQLVLFYALLGFLFESLLLLAFVLFFSSFVSNFLVLFYCLCLFIVGHFLESLFYFIDKSSGALSIFLYQGIRFFPNLEKINWKSAVVYQDSLSLQEVVTSSLYMFLWIGFILSLSLLIMEKREYA